MNVTTRAVVTLTGLHKPACDWFEFQAMNSIDACGFDDDLANEVRDLADVGLELGGPLVDNCDFVRNASNPNVNDLTLEAIDVPVQGLVLLLCHWLKNFEPNGYVAFEFDLEVLGFVTVKQGVVVTAEGPLWYPKVTDWMAGNVPAGKVEVNQ